MKKNRKTILITGGAGLIGSFLAERLLSEGHTVVILDNFHTGDKDNVLHLLANPKLEIIRHDIIQPFHIEADHIYNLACPASPIHYRRSPVRTVETCVVGTVNVLTLARETKARVLQASTSEVYGNPAVHPQPEDYWGCVNPIGQRGCYDEGKRVAETIFFDFMREYGVDIRIARIFNTYGPRMRPDDGRVISQFVVQALKGEPITVFGDGSQTRSFCYVTDMVEGLISLMNTEDLTGPVNLGNSEEISIKKIADLVIKATGSSSEVVYQPLPPDDPLRRKPDISLARERLGWQPKIGLEEGLLEVVKYFRTIIDD